MCDHCGCQDRREVELRRHILAANEELAARNRDLFRRRGIVALNLISAPGSGKTTLLEATIEALGPEVPLAVIEGDPETDRDAARIRARGVPVVQITTGGACHLDAGLVHRALHELEGHRFRLLFIENVGNLVCPASFDLGETARVVLVSVPEGSDKPAKYPAAFHQADLFLITKTDLLPHFDFDLEEARTLAARVNPRLRTIALSARTGEGLEEWLACLRAWLSA